MGYWGTLVVARPHGLLVDQDGVAGFGHRHRWLRELSHGWQLLEVTGFNDPPDLAGPCVAVVASTGHPVLAAYISNSYCAAMCAAIPGRVGPLTHLSDVSGLCGVFQHQPQGLAEPSGRSIEEVVAELTAWSAAAGFRADEDRLRTVIGSDDTHSRADDLVFELVKALGLTRIGRTLPWSFPALDWPFSAVMSGYGPGFWARSYAARRASGVDMPVLPWETQALALEAELWASLYRPAIDVAALARRAAYLTAAQEAAPKPWDSATVPVPATEPPVLNQIDLDLLASLESRLANGALPGWAAKDQRRHADARATVRDTAGTQPRETSSNSTP